MVGKFYLLLFAMALSFFCFLSPHTSLAQCTGNINLFTQAQVDAFPSRGCSVVDGWVTIAGWNNGNITNLDSLYVLEEINGNISIQQNQLLTNINGLRNLRYVRNEVNIVDNTALPNLDGLSGLLSCDQFLISGGVLTDISGLSNLETCDRAYIHGQPRLMNIAGFDKLTSVRIFSVQRNAVLTDLSTLTGPGEVVGALSIENNPMMTSLTGLENVVIGDTTDIRIFDGGALTSLTGLGDRLSLGKVEIARNLQLSDISALSSLTTLDGLSLQESPLITNLDALSNLTYLGELWLSRNESLNSISALSGIVDISRDLAIMENPALTSFDGLQNITIVGGRVWIVNQSIIDMSGFAALVSAGELELVNNANLTSLNGLSSLVFLNGVYNFPDTIALRLTGNPRLTDLSALNQLNSLGGDIRIIDCDSLKNLNGLENITSIRGAIAIQGNARLETMEALSNVMTLGQATWFNVPGVSTSRSFLITGNDALKDLAIRRVTRMPGSLVISSNAALENLNDLGGLEQIGPQYAYVDVIISGNTMLTNVDSLSSAKVVVNGPDAYYMLRVDGNTMLDKFCGLFNLVADAPGNFQHFIANNGADTTPEQIIAEGPCGGGGPDPEPQPGDLVFTNVTDSSMTVSFEPDSIAPSGGYLLLMRAYGSPVPDEVPVDGAAYNVGGVIGSSTIVVGKGSGNNTSEFNIVYLLASTPYHFALYSFDSNLNYTGNPVLGSQSTLEESEEPGPITQPTDLVFSDVTDNSMTVSFTASTNENVDGYLTVMRAFSSSYPDDVPVDGTEYSVGNVIGYSSIVVGKGMATTLNIVYLNPDTEYWFDVYSYTNNGSYDYVTTTPLEASQRTSTAIMASAFPNPFVESVTIRFAVKADNAQVRVVIFDNMGTPVAELLNGEMNRGTHEISWSGLDNNGNKAKGLYHYSITGHDEPVRGTVVAK